MKMEKVRERGECKTNSLIGTRDRVSSSDEIYQHYKKEQEEQAIHTQSILRL